ncbi:MAG: DMT family transporter [Syntrophomonadaceae bacterium]|nr:DMT family transporter [Syntrophomonadaceae bacterium]
MDQGREPVFNPYLAVVLGVAAVSFASIFTRLITAPPLIIAFYRLAFTVLLLSPWALSRAGRSELITIRGKDLALALLAGVFLAVHFVVWITSLQYTSIASSTVLVTMQPLFVVTLGFLFLKEKINRISALGALVALTGSIIVGAGDFRLGGMAFWGDLLAFAGAFFVAVYVLIGRSLRSRFSLFPYVFLVFSSAALSLLLFNLFTRLPLYPYPASDWLWFVALALIPTIFGHTVFNWALRYVQAAVVSVSILGEPVGATFLGYLVFREVPGVFQLVGGLVIISGLFLFVSRVKN